LIDPNEHCCGTVPPHGVDELPQPEPGYYAIGMKSYGPAPTFLLATGYEHARSIVAASTATGRPPALWQLYLVFGGLGAAMAMALYEAATAVIVSWFDAGRRQRALLVARRAGVTHPRDLIRAASRDSRFWCLAVVFIAHAAAMSTMTVHLVGFLVSKGHPATCAATGAGLLGVP